MPVTLNDLGHLNAQQRTLLAAYQAHGEKVRQRGRPGAEEPEATPEMTYGQAKQVDKMCREVIDLIGVIQSGAREVMEKRRRDALTQFEADNA